jgi:hypothetical protein
LPILQWFQHVLIFLSKIFTVNQFVAKVLVKIVPAFFGKLTEAGLPLRPVLKSGFSKKLHGMAWKK